MTESTRRQVIVRLSQEDHDGLKAASEYSGKSMNAIATDAIREHLIRTGFAAVYPSYRRSMLSNSNMAVTSSLANTTPSITAPSSFQAAVSALGGATPEEDPT